VNIEEAKKGAKVRWIGDEDVGTVHHVDLDDNMAWVGYEGQVGLIDIDPAELELVS
jgi:hypothetical protein